MPTRSELEAAYRATCYRVFLPGGLRELRVDVADASLSAWLADNGYTAWALLTAWNPGSEACSEADNRQNQAALEIALLERGYEPYAGENEADGGPWPVEDSCFVPGLDEAEAAELARRFGQRAIVCGDGANPPRLVWMDGGVP